METKKSNWRIPLVSISVWLLKKVPVFQWIQNWERKEGLFVVAHIMRSHGSEEPAQARNDLWNGTVLYVPQVDTGSVARAESSCCTDSEEERAAGSFWNSLKIIHIDDPLIYVLFLVHTGQFSVIQLSPDKSSYHSPISYHFPLFHPFAVSPLSVTTCHMQKWPAGRTCTILFIAYS